MGHLRRHCLPLCFQRFRGAFRLFDPTFYLPTPIVHLYSIPYGRDPLMSHSTPPDCSKRQDCRLTEEASAVDHSSPAVIVRMAEALSAAEHHDDLSVLHRLLAALALL